MSRLLASPSGGQTWSRSDCVSATAVVAVLPLWDADLYPFVFQRFSIPIGIATPVRQEPFGLWKVPPPGGSAHVVADLACRHEELQRPALSVCHGMKLGVQPAPLRGELIPRSNSSSPPHPPDPPPHSAGLRGCTAAPVPPHTPFFTATLKAVRGAFR